MCYIIIELTNVNKYRESIMSFLDLAKKRRSIRFYDERAISREDLESCVEAALYAPSACNSQPWKFIIVDGAEQKKELSKSFLSGTYEMNSFAPHAAAFIVVVAENMKFPAWAGSKLRKTDFRKIDIGIACAHLVLRAHELGIGTCILGWFDEKRLRKIFSVPAAKKIELVIAMGYPGERKLPEKILKDRDEVVSWNSY
jgi:nitroreductase